MLCSWLGKTLVPSSWSEEHLLIYQRRQLCDDKQAPSVLANFKLIVKCFSKRSSLSAPVLNLGVLKNCLLALGGGRQLPPSPASYEPALSKEVRLCEFDNDNRVCLFRGLSHLTPKLTRNIQKPFLLQLCEV